MYSFSLAPLSLLSFASTPPHSTASRSFKILILSYIPLAIHPRLELSANFISILSLPSFR